MIIIASHPIGPPRQSMPVIPTPTSSMPKSSKSCAAMWQKTEREALRGFGRIAGHCEEVHHHVQPEWQEDSRDGRRILSTGNPEYSSPTGQPASHLDKKEVHLRKESRMIPQIPDLLLVSNIPEIAASSLVRGSKAASPQSQGSIVKYSIEF